MLNYYKERKCVQLVDRAKPLLPPPSLAPFSLPSSLTLLPPPPPSHSLFLLLLWDEKCCQINIALWCRGNWRWSATCDDSSLFVFIICVHFKWLEMDDCNSVGLKDFILFYLISLRGIFSHFLKCFGLIHYLSFRCQGTYPSPLLLPLLSSSFFLASFLFLFFVFFLFFLILLPPPPPSPLPPLPPPHPLPPLPPPLSPSLPSLVSHSPYPLSLHSPLLPVLLVTIKGCLRVLCM